METAQIRIVIRLLKPPRGGGFVVLHSISSQTCKHNVISVGINDRLLRSPLLYKRKFPLLCHAPPPGAIIKLETKVKTHHFVFVRVSASKTMDSCCLIAIWSEESIHWKLDDTYHNWRIYEDISRQMAEQGYSCTWLQCQRKIKDLSDLS